MEFGGFVCLPDGEPAIIQYYQTVSLNTQIELIACPPGRFLVSFDEPEPKLLRFERTAVSTIWNVYRSNGELAGQVYSFFGDYRYCQDMGITITAAEATEIAAYLQKKGEGK